MEDTARMCPGLGEMLKDAFYANRKIYSIMESHQIM